jgi:uncharacterized protein YcnI
MILEVAVPNSPGVSSIAIVYGHAADVKPSEAEQEPCILDTYTLQVPSGKRLHSELENHHL